MRLTTLTLAALFLTAPVLAPAMAPAMAQEATLAPASDTVQAVTANGITMDVQGQTFNIDYAEDGTFVGGDGMFEGTWKADGSKLCITIPGMVENQCTAYPDGKKPGDSFDIESEMGPLTVKIREPAAE
jgi:hypothetical protein